MGFISKLVDVVFGVHGGATKDEFYETLDRDKLSRFLPWAAYDPDTAQYLLQDDTMAFIWECQPVFFAGEATCKTLGGLFNQGLPDSTIIQFVLVAEPHIRPILARHIGSKKRPGRLIERMTYELCDYYDRGVRGMASLGGTPLRKFRLFVVVKFPATDKDKVNLKELPINVNQILDGAGLRPEKLEPPALLDFMRRLFNKEDSANNFYWDENRPLRKQCIFGGTETDVHSDRIVSGGKVFKCITPASFPPYVNAYQTNLLFGGVMGAVSDAAQIKTAFIYSLNIILKNQKVGLHTKCNFILGQQAVGSFAPSLARKKAEYTWAVDELEKGTRFLKVVPALWMYGDDEETVTAAVSRAKRLWEDQGYIMQTDGHILMPLFVSSLPGGFYNIDGFCEQLDRDHVAPVEAVTEILPIQGDFSGFGTPMIPLVGRKGELFGIDLWAYNSHNTIVCARTGGGKSFLINYILNNYYTEGAKIRVIDIGGSYKKMTNLHGAKFLDFAPGSNICLNPFTNICDDPERPDDTQGDLSAIPAVIAQMCFSSGVGTPSTTEMTLIENAVAWAYNRYGNRAGTDSVREYLVNFDKYAGSGGGTEAALKAPTLAFNMSKFCSDGIYGRFFNGPSTFNISNDDFVVLELEHLEQQRPLFSVVTLQVINAVTQDLYLGEKTRKKMVVFDESWKFLVDSGPIKRVIEEGYRRARKYNASFTIITQSILDMKQFGSVGTVIQGNSAFKFYLQSPDFEAALRDGLIDYSPFVMEILKSLSSKAPLYSELFIDSPYGVGVGRLTVDPFNYYTNTSTSYEVEEMDKMIDDGMQVEEAIDEMVRRHRS